MRIDYIDGLKAIGALIVFFCHINSMLCVTTLPKVLQFLNNGEFAVILFLMLSGFSISLSLNRNCTIEKLRHTILNRYFRFAIPLAVVTIIAYLIYLLGAYHNSEVADMLGREFGKHDYTDISIRQVLQMLLFAPMGYNALNAPMWMLKAIFEGTFLVIVLFIAQNSLRPSRRFFVLLFAMVLTSIESIYLTDVILGMLLFNLWNSYRNDTDRFPWVIKICFLASFLIGIMIGNHFSRVGGHVSFFSSVLLSVGSFLIILSVLFSRVLQHLLSAKLFRILGNISFEMYMLHWVVICSLSCGLYLHSTQSEMAVWGIFIITIVAVLILSFVMKKYIEPFVCKPIEKRIMNWLVQ